MTAAELIVYATPHGPLADACDAYFRAVTALAPTVAQTYPPHCTLTGFFHRAPGDIGRIADELAAVLPDGRWAPGDAISVVALRHHETWTGIELESPWLHDVVERFIDEHRVGTDDDALRPKDWLHLSLAYGIDDLTDHRPLADEMVDPTLDAHWQVGLWERRPDGRWTSHS